MGCLSRLFGRNKSLADVIRTQTEKVVKRGPFPKCGGCGEGVAPLEPVSDKKGNRGFLCQSCLAKYGELLRADSIRNFWMCAVCGYRVLAGTEIDREVDGPGNPCPQCGTDVNISLVNLDQDRPTASGYMGEPLT